MAAVKDAPRVSRAVTALVAAADDLAVGLGGTCVMLDVFPKNYLCTGRYMDITGKTKLVLDTM